MTEIRDCLLLAHDFTGLSNARLSFRLICVWRAAGPSQTISTGTSESPVTLCETLPNR